MSDGIPWSDWKCCGCGKTAPVNCDCATMVLYRHRSDARGYVSMQHKINPLKERAGDGLEDCPTCGRRRTP